LFSDYRGIPPQAKLLIVLSFIPNILIGFIYADLSYFLPTFQGIGPGLPITVIGVTLVAESIPFGILADRYGRLKMLILGNVCAGLSIIGFALTSNLAIVLLVAVLEGTGEASYAVSVSALLAEKAGDEKRTAAFSLLAFVGWIAGALGSFVIYSITGLQYFGLDLKSAHIVLYVTIALLTLSITPFLLKIKESRTSYGRKQILPRKSGKVLAEYATYSVLIAAGAGLFVPLILFWFKLAYAVPDTLGGLVLGFTNLLTAFVVFASPRLARRFGLVRATVLTQASSTIFMVVIPSSPNFAVASSLYLVRVFLMNLSNPLTQSLIMGLVSPDERGMASGITASLWRLPNSLSTVVGSTLMEAGYLGAPFYIATVLYVIGIALFWFMFRNTVLPEERRAKAQPPIQSSSLEGPEVER